MLAFPSHSDMKRPTDHVPKALLHKPVAGDREVLPGRDDVPNKAANPAHPPAA